MVKHHNFQPRVLPPKEPPRRDWLKIVAHTALFSLLFFDAIMFTKISIDHYRIKKSTSSTEQHIRELMFDVAQKDESAPAPEGDDAQPLHLETAPLGNDQTIIIGHSEALPESDELPNTGSHEPAKLPKKVIVSEPSADELNTRWFVRHPRGQELPFTPVIEK